MFQSRINPVSCCQPFSPFYHRIRCDIGFNPVSIRSRVARAAPQSRASAGFPGPFSKIALRAFSKPLRKGPFFGPAFHVCSHFI